MRILVTGGAGYVGSHACKVLAHAGWEPVVFDNLSRGHRWSVKWGPLVSSDLCDRDALRRAIAEHRPHGVGQRAEGQTVRNRFADVDLVNPNRRLWHPQRHLHERLNLVLKQKGFADPDKTRVAATDCLARIKQRAHRQSVIRASGIVDARFARFSHAHNPFCQMKV